MADTPLPAGYLGSEQLPKTRQSLVNCFNAGGAILQRPGITELATTSRVARGQFVWNGSLYQVASQDLIKITDVDTGAFSVIGTIAGTARVDTAIGFNHAVIVVGEASGKGYTLDSSDTLTEITDPQFESSNSVANINGRFIYIPFNGDPAFYSNVGDGSAIETTSLFDAEELPDLNKVTFNFRNVLYIGGEDSFELFRNVAGGTTAFSRLNARIQYGYIGAILEYQDTFVFIGNEKGEAAGIYAIGSGRADKISNAAIDLILAGYTEAQLTACISGRIKWRGYDLAVFTLENDSFGFIGGNWFILSTTTDNSPFRGGYITQFNGNHYTAYSDKIGRFGKINTDYGEPFERRLETGFYEPENLDFAANYIELGISQGYTSSANVALSLSRDNVLYSEPFYRDVGGIGQYENKLVWQYPGGLGYYTGFMGIKLSTYEDIDFAIDKLTVGI